MLELYLKFKTGLDITPSRQANGMLEEQQKRLELVKQSTQYSGRNDIMENYVKCINKFSLMEKNLCFESLFK